MIGNRDIYETVEFDAWAYREGLDYEENFLIEKYLGDSQEKYYRLDWSDEEMRFGQKRITFQSLLDWTHCFFR